MTPCIFCDLLAGGGPVSWVHRDERCAAFMDIQPVNPGHILVVPNVHAERLGDIDGETAAHLMTLAHRLTAALRASGLPCEGVNLFLADGEAAGQEVMHVHLHVFPRSRGDGFGLRFGPHYVRRPRPDLDDAAARIRAALAATDAPPPPGSAA